MLKKFVRNLKSERIRCNRINDTKNKKKSKMKDYGSGLLGS